MQNHPSKKRLHLQAAPVLWVMKTLRRHPRLLQQVLLMIRKGKSQVSDFRIDFKFVPKTKEFPPIPWIMKLLITRSIFSVNHDAKRWRKWSLFIPFENWWLGILCMFFIVWWNLLALHLQAGDERSLTRRSHLRRKPNYPQTALQTADRETVITTRGKALQQVPSQTQRQVQVTRGFYTDLVIYYFH